MPDPQPRTEKFWHWATACLLGVLVLWAMWRLLVAWVIGGS